MKLPLRGGNRKRASWVGIAALASASACARNAPSVLDPRGPAARQVTALWWPMLWASVAVFVFVAAMAFWGVVRGRRRDESDLPRVVPWGDRFILISGLGVTTLILVAFFLVSLRAMSTLASDAHRARLIVDVTGHDWWWEARYPNGAVTANEIHIPTGEPVLMRLHAADVIHSLWVPQLAPKIDLIPGRTNALWMQADRPGAYRGQCAEYCGIEHARMALLVIADPPDAFRTWMERNAQIASAPADALGARGRDVFLASTCAGCHTIRGTPARAQLGPDLTHLADRTTIGADLVGLTPDALAHWILDPNDLKPGVTMPPTSLTPDEVRAIVAYLMSLR